MENDIEDLSETKVVETHTVHIQESLNMAPQKKSRINRPFFVALFLVIIILAIYIMSSRPNKDISERMHNNWVKTMTKESSIQNESVGLRHFERHEMTRPAQATGSEETRVSMILPVEIPEDLHKARTESMPLQYGSDKKTNVAGTETNLHTSEVAQNIDIILDKKDFDEYKNDRTDNTGMPTGNDYDDEDDEDDYDEDEDKVDGEKDDDDQDDVFYKNLVQKEQYQIQNSIRTVEQNMTTTDQSFTEESTADSNKIRSMNDESKYFSEKGVPTNLITMQLGPVNFVKTDPQQMNSLNLEHDNLMKPDLEQANYEQLEKGQVKNANQVQRHFENSALEPDNNVDKQESQLNFEQANYGKLETEQAFYAKPDQVKMNNINQGEVYHDKFDKEQANFVNTEQFQMKYSNHKEANFAQPELTQMNNISQGHGIYGKQRVEQRNNVNKEQTGYAQQELRPSINIGADPNSNINSDKFIGDNKVPSYNDGLNSNHKYPDLGNAIVEGSIAFDSQGNIRDENGGTGIILDTNRLAQTYQNGYGDNGDRKIGKQLFNINVYQTIKQPNTQSTYTLSQALESRMKLHKVLKDMHDIVDYGSAKSDEENKRPWNEDENREHVYDLNRKVDMFRNLRMQVKPQVEPITGTKPMRPPYKSSIQYPDYLTPINWETSFEHVKAPTFECVPLRTINKYIRICIHPPTIRSQVSTKLKAEATWEYSALMDMQKALMQNKEAFLIDIGASFGVFSLAAAALNRHVIAVEPYSSHIQVLKQSVALNSFRNHITLFQAVVSDRRSKVLIKPLGDHVDNVYIQTVEEDEQTTNYTLIVNTVTFDDIEKICPGRVAVLKIDIPGFEKRALQYSYFFFKYIYVTHVFMHWNTNDKGLCLFVTRFFVERGYQPYSELNASARLDIQNSAMWTNDIVIWKL